MSNLGKPERATRNRVVALFHDGKQGMVQNRLLGRQLLV